MENIPAKSLKIKRSIFLYIKISCTQENIIDFGFLDNPTTLNFYCELFNIPQSFLKV